jgi:hypothetical protein
MCGCQSNKTSSSGYVYVDPQNRQTTYRTEVEAKAAKVRAGGVGQVRAA